MRKVLVAATLTFFALPSWAQTQRDFDWCQAKDAPDKNIIGCTILIQYGAPAGVYHKRALAYLESKRYDEAIADFTRTIALDPKDHSYYTLRGYAYEMKGQRDRAIADYRRAVKLNPKESEFAKAAEAKLKALNAKP